jgi:hypothetical protein
MHPVLSTLVHTARALCDQDSLNDELQFLEDTFRQNGYSDQQIHRGFDSPVRVGPPSNDPDLIALLPFVGSTFTLY